MAVPRTDKVPGEDPYYVVPAEREITVRDLLTHTSGLMSWQSPIPAPKLEPNATLATHVPKFAQVPGGWTSSRGRSGPTAALAGRTYYRGSSRSFSGQPYDEFLRLRLFEPLGIKDTFFSAPADKRPRLVTLYQRSPEGLRKAANQEIFMPTYFSGAGGLMSTAEATCSSGRCWPTAES